MIQSLSGVLSNYNTGYYWQHRKSDETRNRRSIRGVQDKGIASRIAALDALLDKCSERTLRGCAICPKRLECDGIMQKLADSVEACRCDDKTLTEYENRIKGMTEEKYCEIAARRLSQEVFTLDIPEVKKPLTVTFDRPIEIDGVSSRVNGDGSPFHVGE